MDSMRDMLRKTLGRSLEALPELDRLEAAWPVACGRVLAGRGQIAGFEDGVVQVLVEDGPWLDQLRSMRGVLEAELARISGVRIAAIHFEVKKLKPRSAPPESKR
jgi:predicted nucleic acid-binding Zn ribbon protein